MARRRRGRMDQLPEGHGTRAGGWAAAPGRAAGPRTLVCLRRTSTSWRATRGACAAMAGVWRGRWYARGVVMYVVMFWADRDRGAWRCMAMAHNGTRRSAVRLADEQASVGRLVDQSAASPSTVSALSMRRMPCPLAGRFLLPLRWNGPWSHWAQNLSKGRRKEGGRGGESEATKKRRTRGSSPLIRLIFLTCALIQSYVPCASLQPPLLLLLHLLHVLLLLLLLTSTASFSTTTTTTTFFFPLFLLYRHR